VTRGRVNALSVLKERDFRRYFIGQSASLLGDGMVGVALAFAVLDLTGSPADLGTAPGPPSSTPPPPAWFPPS
jgi:hypothetical protein